MSKLRVASWNIEGRLSRFAKKGRGTPEHIVHGIETLDADVVFLPEAFTQQKPVEAKIFQEINSLGYEVQMVPYIEGGPDRGTPGVKSPYLVLLTRPHVEKLDILRLGNLRNALIAEIKIGSEILRIIGIHLDDRSESFRLRQLEDLIPVINSSDVPTILMGDFNAMHREARPAHLLQNPIVGWAVENLIPLSSVRSLARRARQMAIGTTIGELLSETSLEDVDADKLSTTTPKVRGNTWLPSVRMIGIDHIMVSESVGASSFAVGRYDMGSDHRPISADVEL